jgi:cytochrome c biogenesis protein CcmG/thiol:disulfide interchange protein DsbE
VLLRINSKRKVLYLLLLLTAFPAADNLAAKTETATPIASRRAPSFTRLDLNQQQVRLVDYRGKVVLLNFWATWCVPCLTEMPHFVEWQQEYGRRGLQVIGISMDDEEQPVRITYQKYRLNYPVVMGDEKIGEMYGGILGLPVTFLIDRSGKIRFKHEGDTDIKTIESEMRGLLRGSSSSLPLGVHAVDGLE